MNDRLLQNSIGGLFYKIISNVEGTSWAVFQYPTAADRTNNTNGTQQSPSLTLNGGNNLNKELVNGIFRPDMFRLNTQFLDVDGNVIVNQNTSLINSQGFVNIPVSVKRLERDTLEFLEGLVFESNLTTGSLEMKLWFTDKQGRAIAFDSSNPPELLVSF